MLFNKIADNSKPNSLATRLRKKRFLFFLSLLEKIEPPISILDVGGTEQFWDLMGLCGAEGVNITLLNVDEYKISSPNVVSLKGDARDLTFKDASFDVVFSNSVIEHVGALREQKRMAEEIQRVGKRYFVQTPNKYFFIEPHFLFPYFQLLPTNVRIWLVRNFKLGWFDKQTSVENARELVESITLLTKNELLALFPGGNLYKEKLFGLTKSYIVYSGWDTD